MSENEKFLWDIAQAIWFVVLALAMFVAHSTALVIVSLWIFVLTLRLEQDRKKEAVK